MKIHGKKGKNFIIEVTQKEMDTLQTALFEWDEVESCTNTYEKKFRRLLNTVHKAQDTFDSLPLVKTKAIKGTAPRAIQDTSKKDDL